MHGAGATVMVFLKRLGFGIFVLAVMTSCSESSKLVSQQRDIVTTATAPPATSVALSSGQKMVRSLQAQAGFYYQMGEVEKGMQAQASIQRLGQHAISMYGPQAVTAAKSGNYIEASNYLNQINSYFLSSVLQEYRPVPNGVTIHFLNQDGTSRSRTNPMNADQIMMSLIEKRRMISLIDAAPILPRAPTGPRFIQCDMITSSDVSCVSLP